MDALLAFLNQWENVPYLVSGAIALLLITLQVIGFGLSEALDGPDADVDADVDADFDLDHDVDLDMDVHGDLDVHLDVDAEVDVDVDVHADVDVDLDLDHDVDCDIDHDLDHDVDVGDAHHGGAVAEGASVLVSILTWLNVGRVPFMVVFHTVLLFFAIYGLVGTDVLQRQTGWQGWLLLGITAPAAFALALVTARLVAGAIARFVPINSNKRTGPHALLNRNGRVVSGQITATAGRVRVRDADGDVFTVHAILDAELPPLSRGARVHLLRYDSATKTYRVKPVANTQSQS